LQNQLKKWSLTTMCYRITIEKIADQLNLILD